MWDMAVCLHNTEPSGFSTFCVAVVTHVTAHDVSVTRRWNFKITQHLSYKLSSFAKTSVSYSQRDVCEQIEGSYAIIFLGFVRRNMTFRQEVTRLSCESKADSDLRLWFSVNCVVASELTRLRNPSFKSFQVISEALRNHFEPKGSDCSVISFSQVC